jgi:hypothetical protein
VADNEGLTDEESGTQKRADEKSKDDDIEDKLDALP